MGLIDSLRDTSLAEFYIARWVRSTSRRYAIGEHRAGAT